MSVKTIMPWLYAASGVVCLLYIIFLSFATFGATSDFPEYYAAARLMLTGHGLSVYDIAALGAMQHNLFPTLGARIIPIYVPPIALPWIAPIGWVPLSFARYFWKFLLTVALAASGYLISKTFTLSKNETLLFIFCLCIAGPTFEALRIDQLATLLLFAFMLAINALKQHRPIFAGIALSFLLLKPQELLPIIFYLAGAKRYRVLIAFAAFSMILLGLSMIEIGAPGITNYRHLLTSSVENSTFMRPELTPTLRGQLLLLFPNARTLVMTLSSVMFFLFLLFSFFVGFRFARFGRWLEVGLLVSIPLGLVLALHCHLYDLLLLVPSLMVLVRDRKAIPSWLLGLVALLVAAFAMPIYLPIHYNYLLRGGIINPYFWILSALSIGIIFFVFKNPDEFRHDIS